MTELATVNVVADDTDESFAAIQVAIVEMPDGFYFAFPRLEEDGTAPLPGQMHMHGPHETRETALEEAGTFLIDAAEHYAREVLGEEQQEIAA